MPANFGFRLIHLGDDANACGSDSGENFGLRSLYEGLSAASGVGTMDTFTSSGGSVVGPYNDSVSIAASGPVDTNSDFINAEGDIAGSFSDLTGDHAFLMHDGSSTVFDGAPGAAYTTVVGIDSTGAVIGNYADVVNGIDVTHGYTYRNGVATPIDLPGWTTSEVYAVNAAGDFAGQYTDGTGDHAFVVIAGAIRTFDSPSGFYAPFINAINSNGDVAGRLIPTDGTQQKIFLNRNRLMSSTDLPAGVEVPAIYGVDDAGTVIGRYQMSEKEFYFTANLASPTDSGLKQITVPTGGTLQSVIGIDALGDVAGTYTDVTGTHGFVTTALGASMRIDGSPTATSTEITGIDADGTIVGIYQDGTGEHVFADRSGTITSASPPPSTRDIEPSGADAAGEIIGSDGPLLTGGDATFLANNGTAAQLNLQGRPIAADIVTIDRARDVIGTAQDADGTHMFVDQGGTVTQMDAAPGAVATIPQYVDAAGDIIGRFTAADSSQHIFVDKQGTFTSIDVPAPAGEFSVPFLSVGNAAGDFGGTVQFSTTSGYVGSRYFTDIRGAITVFDIPSSVGTSPTLVGMDPQGDIGIRAVQDDQLVSVLRLADGSYQSIEVPGSIAGTTSLMAIDGAGNYIGTYQAASAQSGAPVTLGFVKLAASGAFITVTPPSDASSFDVSKVDAAGDIFGEAYNTDNTQNIFEQKAGTSKSLIVDLDSGTGRESLVGVDAAGDIAANAFLTQGFDDEASSAFLVINGNVVEVKGSPSATSTFIRGIDTEGDIFGTYTDASGTHNFASFASSAPLILGTHASSTSAEAPTPPFTAVTVQDLRDGATDTLTIALSGGGGTLADGAGYGGASTLKQTGPGTYMLTGAATGITAELDALFFTPTAGAPGTPNPTTFTLTDASSVGGSATETVTDATTVVTDTAEGTASTGTGAGTTGTGGAGTSSTSTGGSSPAPASGTATPTPTPVSVTPTPIPVAPGSGGVVGVTPADAVSFNDQVYYDRGVLVVSGTASSAAGVSRVEITATLENGKVKDLGSAAVDANGNFAFRDRVGAHTQGFITATETDKAGVRTSALADYSLTGGLGGTYTAEQDRYSADGSAVTATDLYKTSGAQDATLNAGGLAFFSDTTDVFQNDGQPSSTFVFDPGYGNDVVKQFRADNTDHDTLSFKGSDFGNTPAGQLANLLAHSQDNAAGNVVITDPTSKDKVVLVGISTGLFQQFAQQDVTFHA